MWLLKETDWQPLIDKSFLIDGAYVRELEGSWQYNSAGSHQALTEDGFLPAEDGSLHNLILLLAPNRIPMPMFYMFLAEARRTVVADGLLTIVTKDLPSSFMERIGDFWQKRRALHADHFTSPEHWQPLAYSKGKCCGLTLGVATYRRTTFT